MKTTFATILAVVGYSQASDVEGTCDSPSPPCTDDESCCEDAAGWECCITQGSFCVAPRGSFQVSTCCPRETVGCIVGSVGCCNPARPWQLLGDAATDAGVRRPARLQPGTAPIYMADFKQAALADGKVAYALFTQEGLFVSSLQSLAIETSSGKVITKSTVTGPVADYYNSLYGESTRLFPWDPAGSQFIFADADYSQAGPNYPLTVYAIDAATGVSTAQSVNGCAGEPLGLAWDAESGKLIVGTHDDNTASFCSINVDTGAGTPLYSVPRGTQDESEGFYSAYISHFSSGKAHRVGHRNVREGIGAGVAVSEDSKATWFEASVADSHSSPVSVQKNPLGGFVSLSPRSGVADFGSLDVITWDTDGTSKVLATLANASFPTAVGTGPLGYVADAVDESTFAGMTVRWGTAAYTLGDKWQISSTDLATGESIENVLSPQPSKTGAGGTSLSGFGLPAASSSITV